MMKKFAVLASLFIVSAFLIIPCTVFGDEITVTPEQWGAATSPAAPGQWRHIGTTGDIGSEPAAPAMEKNEAAPEKKDIKKDMKKETKEPGGIEGKAGAKETKEGKEPAGAKKETKQTAPKGGKIEAAGAEETREAPQETKAPEYRIFNLNLPEPAKPQPAPAPTPATEQPATAPATEQPATAPQPGYIEKDGMVIPESSGRKVTVTPEQ